ncbi:MAG: serine protease [bacterium]|jgi:hypothetical protein
MDAPHPGKGPPGTGRWLERKLTYEARRRFRTVFQGAILAIIMIVAAVFFRDVIRDRKVLEQSGRNADDTARHDSIGAGAGGDPGVTSGPSPPLGAISGRTASPDSVDTSEAVFRKASPSVVTVKIYSGEEKRLTVQGSGVVVDHGVVVTNRHVVESGSEIRVIDRGQSHPASVVYADREYDMCALGVPGLPAPPAEMASLQTVRVGQRVYAIGAPRGLELTISDGLVSAIRPYGTFPVIQTNAAISKGSSGGGLFDTDGRLVGITTAAAIEGQNINFALAADLVSQLPARTADIGTLAPIVPVRRADDINDKELLDDLQEGKRAIAAGEAELKAMVEEINRYAFTLDEMRQSLNGFRASRDTKAFNDLVPRYNQLAGRRDEAASRYERKRQAVADLVERHNRTVERYRNQGRLQ